jgi:hypothetical protein
MCSLLRIYLLPISYILSLHAICREYFDWKPNITEFVYKILQIKHTLHFITTVRAGTELSFSENHKL